MSITLTPRQEQQVLGLVQAGVFPTAEAALDTALEGLALSNTVGSTVGANGASGAVASQNSAVDAAERQARFRAALDEVMETRASALERLAQ